MTDNTNTTIEATARALVLHHDDNVAIALCALPAGSQVQPRAAAAQTCITLREPIALCHKFALRDIAAGEVVVKYGESIGRATCAIAAGAHVHIHNLASTRGI